MPVLTLLSRAYCHLCDEMRDALRPIAERHGVPMIEVDVDAYPDLEAAYGERVPVLMLGAPADGHRALPLPPRSGDGREGFARIRAINRGSVKIQRFPTAT